MNWKTFWQQQGSGPDPLLQVGRQGGQLAQYDEWLAKYAEYIAVQLRLTREDTVLDVCCGNGLLTHHLSKHCKAILGVDFSEPHIGYANQLYAASNVQFVCWDALQLKNLTTENELFKHGFTKGSLCFSFQYFESVEAGKQVLEGMFKHVQQELFLGDIPDRDKFMVYYNTPQKLLRLVKQMLLQRNDMGKFWSEQELAFIAASLHKKGMKLTQPRDFPYAHYRMDYLISK